MDNATTAWTTCIKPKNNWLDINIKELIHYRDLIKLFVYRDFVVYYKQTILGPLWFLIKPLITTIIYTLVFNKIARIPTDSVPPMLFYLTGTILWNYFSTCLNSTSNTFVQNAGIFGKVYFPRMAVPIATVISQLVQFGIQFLLFTAIWLFFKSQGAPIELGWEIALLPLLVLQMAALGLGFGMIVSSLVTKYRDLSFLMEFAVQLWMYASPVVYPLSQIPVQYRAMYSLNPMVSVIELFRKSFLGISSFNISYYLIGWISTIFILFIGMILFHKVEKSFMDTV
jgi:lipopolysaccharide transport system permease protein